MERRNNSTIPPLSRPVNAPALDLGLVVPLGLLIPFIIIGNAFVCFAFLKFPKLRTATNCFLFSLALADLAVGLVLIPLWIAYIATRGFEELPEWFRTVYYLLDITCSVASMANLTGVSLERCYGVCCPLRHMSMSIKYAVLTSIASWAYALGVASISLFDDEKHAWVITTMTCLGFLLPFVIMTGSYGAILHTLRQKSLQSSQQLGKNSKTICTLLTVSVIFILCWLPFAVGSLVINYCHQCAIYVLSQPKLHIFPKLLHYSNSCVNPVLYSLFTPSFKAAFKQIIYGPQRRRTGMQRRSTLLTDNSYSGFQIKRKSTGNMVMVSFKEKSNPSLTVL